MISPRLFLACLFSFADDAATGGAADAIAKKPTPASPADIEGVDKAHKLASQIGDLFGDTFRETTFLGWAQLLAGIFLGLVAGKIIASFLRGSSERMKARNWPVRAALFRHAAGPASLALFALGFFLGFTNVRVPKDITTFEIKAVGFLYILAIAWFLYNLVDLIDLALHKLAGKTVTRLDDTVITLLRKALRIFLLIMFVLFVAENFFNADISAWLAGLGIAGLAVSLAAQDSIKNLFGSLTVLIERPFGLGDRIIFGAYDGTVENIGLRSSKIRTGTGNLVTIPNMRFTDGSIENISARPFLGRTFMIGIAYDTAPQKVEEAISLIRGILTSPGVAEPISMPTLPPRVFFSEFGGDSLNIAVNYSYDIKSPGRDWWTYQAHAEQINLRILRAMAAAKIELAFKTQTLFLASDPARPLNMRLADGSPAGA